MKLYKQKQDTVGISNTEKNDNLYMNCMQV
jgi:hypothetical protein